MKYLFTLLLCTVLVTGYTQVEKIEIPSRVVYHYCDTGTLGNAKRLIIQELGDAPAYKLVDRILFLGPVLWKRFKKIKTLSAIEGGNVTLMVDKSQLEGKMTQELEDSKKVWDQVRSEVKGKTITLRKATVKELEYYWSVISFDIDEPLLIADTGEHRYILNLSPKNLQLVWLDEAP